MMDDQKILDNAPKCNTATHVDNEGDYYKIQVEYQYEDESDCGYEQMFKLNHLKNWEVDDCVLILMRSLADIKELVELRKANAELVTRIAKAELAFAIVEGRNAELEKERELMLEVIKAVAHVGVDFGFGVYQLEDYRIKQSREILEALKAGN
jgi:hypothetical protein